MGVGFIKSEMLKCDQVLKQLPLGVIVSVKNIWSFLKKTQCVD